MLTPETTDALVHAARGANSSALVLMQGGEVLIDEVLDGQGDRPIETMSVTKAVVSLLVGRAVTLGLLGGVDAPVSAHFPEWRQGRKKSLTLRHLMTHTSGLQNVPHTGEEVYPSPDFVQLALCAELAAEPGTRFAYNNKAVNLLMGVIQRATGRAADEFAESELFSPLGIVDWAWQRDAAGNPHGMSGLKLRARDLARLGQLALDDGLVGEAVLIDPAWLRESTAPASEVAPGMGLLWWLLPAWTRYTVGDEHVRAQQEAGASLEQVRALHAVKGTYPDHAALTRRLEDERLEISRLPPGVRWGTQERGPLVGFRHDGWLGQHLVVHRAARLVGVRLIDWQHERAQAPGSDFDSFVDRVVTLGESLG